jgi:hypothetical protein
MCRNPYFTFRKAVASGFKKIAGTIKLALNQNNANRELLFKQQEIIEREEPERILYNGKAIYPII